MPLPCRALTLPIALVALVAVAAPIAGCGGGGAGRTSQVNVVMPSGNVHVTVAWPTSDSRVIPTNCQSIRLDVRDGVTTIASTLITRPTTTATLTDIPVGSLSVRATAYASTDGTGTPLAVATTPASVTDGATTSVSLTMASTIATLDYAPNPFVIGAGTSLPLVVTARDSGGNVVMLDPSAITYSSSNSGLFSVAADGTVTAGAGIGLGTLTVTEANSGRTLTIPTTVAVGVSVTPAVATINVNATTTFVATVVGSANPAVTWSVRESGGGTVSAAGVYTAPTRRGVYHVDATSVADNTRKATATITVTAGSIDANVH